jgi:hypothetical protein
MGETRQNQDKVGLMHRLGFFCKEAGLFILEVKGDLYLLEKDYKLKGCLVYFVEHLSFVYNFIAKLNRLNLKVMPGHGALYEYRCILAHSVDEFDYTETFAKLLQGHQEVSLFCQNYAEGKVTIYNKGEKPKSSSGPMDVF